MVIEKGYPLPLYITVKEDMTDEELFELCAANKHLRIERDENNQLIIMSPTGGKTSRKHVKILSALDQWNNENKGGEVFDSSAGFRLPDSSMRSPDVAWVKTERWNSLSEDQQDHFIPFAPDFLVEVLSPTDYLKPAQKKMQRWITNGAKLAWLLAPKQQLSFIYRANGTVDKTEGFNQTLSGEDVLPGFTFDLSVLL